MKVKLVIIPLLIIMLAFPTYANLIYSRTYYGNEVKITNQYDAGEYGYVSCVPTSVKMILDYQGVKSENVSVMFYKMSGNPNGVYWSNAIDYLNSLPYTLAIPQRIENKDSFKYYIDQNVPYLLCINPYIIKIQNDDNIPVLLKPIGKDYFTSQNSLHAIAVIGYIETDNELYLEVLDPVSRQVLYYDADNVIEALEWNYLVIVQKYEIANGKDTE